MASVDQRVVSMIFENKQFEAAVKTTLNTLNNLKKNLNFDKASGEFSKIDKASKEVKFTEMANSLDMISNRFSAMGIVGMTVLSNLTTSAMQAAKNIATKLTDAIVSGGKRRALNIAQAKFQFEGLGMDVEAAMKSANEAVDGTAYGLDAAAKAAAQFGASGLQAGDDMTKALRAISGVAAMTGDEYENIANIFTTVAGNGRLMGDQLLQFSGRGLNVAAELSKVMGKSEGDIRKMVSKGEIDFKTFYEAMDNAFGAHAKDANKTFTGSLSNMKAALSRIGAEFATPIYDNMIDPLNALKEVFNGVKKALKPVIDLVAEWSGVLSKFVTNTLKGLDVEYILNKPMNNTVKIIKNLVSAFGNLVRFIGSFVEPVIASLRYTFGRNYISNTLVKLTDNINKFTQSLKSLDKSDQLFRDLMRTFKGLFTIVKSVAEVVAKLASIVGGTLFSVFSKVFEFVVREVLTITGYFGKWIIDIKTLLHNISKLEVFQSIFGDISFTLDTVKEAANGVFDAVTGLILKFTDKAFSIANRVFEKMLVILLSLAKMIDKVVRKVKEFIDWFTQLPAVQKAIESVNKTVDYLKSNFGEAARIIKSKLVDAFNRARDVIDKYIPKVKALIEQYIKLPTFQEVVTNLQEFISNVFEKSSEIFEKVRDVLEKIFDRVKELNEISLKAAIDNFGKLKDKIVELVNITERLKAIKEFFSNIIKTLGGVGVATGEAVSGAQKELQNFMNWLKTKFADIRLGDVIAAGAGASLIALMASITKFIWGLDGLTGQVKGIIETFEKLPKAITGTFKQITQYFKEKGQAERLEAISSVIKSMVLLAGAVALLASMDAARVRESAIVLGVLAGALVALTVVANNLLKDVKPKTIAKTSTAMISAAGSLGILCIALKVLSDIDMDGIAARLIVLGVVMAEFAGFLVIVNKFAPEMNKGSISLVGFSVSMLLIAGAIRTIGGINSAELIQAVGVMATLMLVLTVMIKVSGKAKISAKSAAAIIGIVVSINLMMFAIKGLAKIDHNTITKGISRLITIMGIIAGLMIATKFAGKYAVEAGASLALISAALVIMSFAIKKLASLDSGIMSKAIEAINSILVVFGILIAVTRLAGANAARAGVTLLAAAGAMIVLAGAMVILGKMRPEELKQATTAVTIVMGMFALIIASTSVVRQADSTLRMITISLGILAGALAILALMEPSNLRNATACLSILMGSFALVAASTGMMKNVGRVLKQMILVIGILAGVLIALSALPIKASTDAAISLSTLLIALSTSAVILQNIKTPLSGGAIAAVAELAALIFVLAGVLTAIGGLIALIPGAQDFLNNGIPVLQALGEGLGTFVGSIIGGVIGGMSSGLITVADNLSAFMDHLAPFLDNVSKIDPSVQNGISVIVGMISSLAVADFVSSLGIFGSMGDTITSVSENLPKLGEGVKKYADSIAGMNAGAVTESSNAVKAIMETLNSLPKSGGVWGFLTGDINIDELSQNLPKLADGMKSYSERISGLNSDAVTKTKEACQVIIELAGSLPNTYGGLVSVFTGGTFIDDFANQIPLLGQGLADYSNRIASMNSDAVVKTQQAAKIIIELAGSLPNTYSGLVGIFAGGSSMDDFAKQLPLFGQGLTAYSEAISGMDYKAVKDTEQAVKIVIALSESIPKTDYGIAGIFGGPDINMSNFGNQMADFARSMAMYSDNIADMNSGSVIQTEKAVKIVIDLAQISTLSKDSRYLVDYSTSLPAFAHNMFMYAQNIAGMDTGSVVNTEQAVKIIISLAQISAFPANGELLVNLSGNLPTFAHNMFMYAQNIAGMDTGSVYNTDGAIRMIIDLASYCAAAPFGPDITTKTMALPLIGNHYKQYYEGVKDIDYGIVQTSIYWLQELSNTLLNFPANVDVSSINNFIETLSKAGANSVENFVKAINEGGPKATEALRNSMNSAMQAGETAIKDGGNRMINTIKSVLERLILQAMLILIRGATRFKESGIKLMTSLADGVQQGSNSVNSAITAVLDSAVNTANGFYSAFHTAGNYNMQGLANGMRSGKNDVVGAIEWVSDNAIAAAKEKFKQASPSKIFTKIGAFNTEGLAIGTRKNSYMVIDAIEYVGDSAIEAMQDVISGMNYAIQDSSSFNPVITPILDTTNIDKGLKDLDSRIDNVPMLNVGRTATNFGLALGAMNRLKANEVEIQNGSFASPISQNYEFVQNNYSPKALTRSEIYRQTRNQFSRFKERTAV